MGRYPSKVSIKQGTGGSASTLRAYTRTITDRPDLVTTITEYESSGEQDGRSSTIAYTFYDGAKQQIKEIDTTHPSVSTAKTGPNSSAVTKQFAVKRSPRRKPRTGRDLRRVPSPNCRSWRVNPGQKCPDRNPNPPRG
ncbi:MAG: hypothetical protein HOP29_16380 [Phycisphaerales bacterium]|nr:hypothetical protein [Phycisphaerales bacterium]